MTTLTIFDRYGGFATIRKLLSPLLGPGVNLATRLEASADPMQILVSEQTHELIRDEFSLVERGELELKGFGSQSVWPLEAESSRR